MVLYMNILEFHSTNYAFCHNWWKIGDSGEVVKLFSQYEQTRNFCFSGMLCAKLDADWRHGFGHDPDASLHFHY